MMDLHAPPPPLRRRGVASFYLSLSLALAASGCSPTTTAIPGETFDAGAVFAARTPKITHTFQVRNATGRHVKILNESHSCSCTTVEINKRALRPGETVPLTMSVAIPQQRAEMTPSCLLQTDDPQFPTWTYSLHFTSYPLAEIDPTHIDLGIVNEDRPEEVALKGPYLNLFDSEDSSLPPIGERDFPRELDIQIVETPDITMMPGGVRRVRFPISVRPRELEKVTASFARPFNLKLRDTPLSAMVVWRTVGPLQASPSSISFGLLSADAVPKRSKVVVQSARGGLFRLVGHENSDPAIAVSLGPEASTPKSEHQVEITFDPSRSQSKRVLSGTVAIQTDMDGAGVCSVHWSAFLRRQVEPSR